MIAIDYSNQKKCVDGWMDVKPVLRIACRNQQIVDDGSMSFGARQTLIFSEKIKKKNNMKTNRCQRLEKTKKIKVKNLGNKMGFVLF